MGMVGRRAGMATGGRAPAVAGKQDEIRFDIGTEWIFPVILAPGRKNMDGTADQHTRRRCWTRGEDMVIFVTAGF